MQPLEWLGRGAGVLTAPIAGGIARLRNARTFHPTGLIHRVDLRVHQRCAEDIRTAAARIAGSGLIRLSSSWWKTGERPDLLGIGIRIAPAETRSSPPQDLLFATARSLVTLLPGALTTNVHDFLANDYFAMAPFMIDGVGRVKLKLKTRGRAPEGPGGTDRAHRLLEALRTDDGAGFDLMILRHGEYQPFLRVLIGERVMLDDNSFELSLSVEHDGRGIRPVGFVNGIRRMAYRASTRARTRKRV